MKRGVRSVSARKLILFGCVLGVGVAALALTSCALFNKPPVAGFTVGPSTTGTAPFTVTLSGAASTDPEGEIATYAWDFGDGTTGSGKSVAHTYSVAGTFTIILTVTDNWDATDQAAKTIYVTAAAAAGPTASFTMSASSGTSPVSITFDASGTTYPGGTITAYEWTFGDGGNGFGQVTSHTYFSSSSRTYTVTLLVRASDGKTGTTSKTVSVSPTGGGGTPVANAPSAEFDIQADSLGVAPLQVTFDPSKSEAANGRTLILYTWSFGDSDATSSVSASTQTHVYKTDTSSETFSVTLLVLDNAGASDSMTKTVKAYDHRPVAGFDIANPPGGHEVPPTADPIVYANEAAAITAALTNPAIWQADDVVIGNLLVIQTLPQVVPVVIRSKKIVDTGGTAGANRWFDLNGGPTVTQHTLQTSTGLAISATTPGTPSGYDKHNFSYDPEGQTWLGGVHPTWFPAEVGQAWGIKYLYVNWGDGSGRMRYDYVADLFGSNGMVLVHAYNVTVDGTVRTITMTAEDYMGYESAEFSRTVTLKTGLEGGGDL